MTSRRTENFPHRPRPRQRRQASRLPALPQGGLLTTLTIQQLALENIDRMRAEFPKVQKGEKLDRKPSFKIAADKVAFTIRVNNSALVLEQVKVQDTEVDVKEMSVPVTNFLDALTYYADRIKGGEYDAQLTLLGEKKAARTDKMRTTRAAKKAEPKAE